MKVENRPYENMYDADINPIVVVDIFVDENSSV